MNNLHRLLRKAEEKLKLDQQRITICFSQNNLEDGDFHANKTK